MSALDDVRARYRAGGLHGSLTPGRNPAIVVVDLQYGFTEAQYGPGFSLDDVVEATRSLLSVAREHEVPVWFTTIAFPADGDGIGATWLTKMPALAGLRDGDRSVEIDERLEIRSNERLVVKQTASAFAYTDLAQQLRAAGVDTIFVAGATTSGCIRATIVDACAADLPAFVVRECVGDRERAPHDASLLDIDAKYGDVVSLGDALDFVRGLS
ncbi:MULTISPECIES: isochorismatase family protein [Rhodococcus]|uniref:isochorismatase family protein n=1 Tax=Rhodococcus TaxID=1827 RepID=UPI001F5C34C6|nr:MULTISPECIES: isochorismatase family protein [Rhodococcus]UTT48481.1 isochorismatase family protein [Rhodococcus gordoniae]